MANEGTTKSAGYYPNPRTVMSIYKRLGMERPGDFAERKIAENSSPELIAQIGHVAAAANKYCGSGRTTMMLVTALGAVSEGLSVWIDAERPVFARKLRNRFRQWADDLGIPLVRFEERGADLFFFDLGPGGYRLAGRRAGERAGGVGAMTNEEIIRNVGVAEREAWASIIERGNLVAGETVNGGCLHVDHFYCALKSLPDKMRTLRSRDDFEWRVPKTIPGTFIGGSTPDPFTYLLGIPVVVDETVPTDAIVLVESDNAPGPGFRPERAAIVIRISEWPRDYRRPSTHFPTSFYGDDGQPYLTVEPPDWAEVKDCDVIALTLRLGERLSGRRAVVRQDGDEVRLVLERGGAGLRAPNLDDVAAAVATMTRASKDDAVEGLRGVIAAYSKPATTERPPWVAAASEGTTFADHGNGLWTVVVPDCGEISLASTVEVLERVGHCLKVRVLDREPSVATAEQLAEIMDTPLNVISETRIPCPEGSPVLRVFDPDHCPRCRKPAAFCLLHGCGPVRKG